MQDATGNECTRRQVTASFQGINEENTGKKNLQCRMSLANQFVIYTKRKKYI